MEINFCVVTNLHRNFFVVIQNFMKSTPQNFSPLIFLYSTSLLISCVGIFHNVYDGIGEDMKYQVLTAIIKELANILRVDIEVILANKNPATVEMVCVAMARLLSLLQLQVEEVKDILTAHQLSLEIITNLCYEEDGNW